MFSSHPTTVIPSGEVCSSKVVFVATCEAANALLLKVNQIGSITEAITAYLDSVSTGWGVMAFSSASARKF